MSENLTTQTEDAIDETLAVFDAISKKRGTMLSAEVVATLTAAVMSRRGPGVLITDERLGKHHG